MSCYFGLDPERDCRVTPCRSCTANDPDKPEQSMYKIKTYPSCHGDGFVGLIEWECFPGIQSRPGDIQFGFKSLRDARKWANKRLRELKK